MGRHLINKRMISLFAIIAMSLTLLSSCGNEQIEVSDQNDDNIAPITETGNLRAESEMSTQETHTLSPWAIEYLEQHIRSNVNHVLSGNYPPADINIDLRRIERFVFWENIGAGGYGFVMDRLHNNRVYYSPSSARVEMLEFNRFSAEFREEDLDRLIQAIEQSGLRNWEYSYRDPPPRNGPSHTGHGSWQVGILFDDGTMLRRGGLGLSPSAFPPEEQFRVLTDFVRTIGAEIEERHNAEQTAAADDE